MPAPTSKPLDERNARVVCFTGGSGTCAGGLAGRDFCTDSDSFISDSCELEHDLRKILQNFIEVECIASKRVRHLTEIRYVGRMGKGDDETKTDNSVGEWAYIPPDNPVYIIFKYACK